MTFDKFSVEFYLQNKIRKAKKRKSQINHEFIFDLSLEFSNSESQFIGALKMNEKNKM